MSTSTAAHLATRLADSVRSNRDEIIGLSMAIHGNPEPGFEERAASTLVAETLARHGYAVERPAGSLETAIRARLRGGAGEGPVVAILAEYDALRGLGHGCGHNLISAAGVGAAIALARGRLDLRGEIVSWVRPPRRTLPGSRSCSTTACSTAWTRR